MGDKMFDNSSETPLPGGWESNMCASSAFAVQLTLTLQQLYFPVLVRSCPVACSRVFRADSANLLQVSGNDCLLELRRTD